jgi:hypothetical protein
MFNLLFNSVSAIRPALFETVLRDDAPDNKHDAPDNTHERTLRRAWQQLRIAFFDVMLRPSTAR